MPFESLEADGGLGIVFLGQGRVTEDEFVGFFSSHLKQAKHASEKHLYALGDFTAVTGTGLSFEAMEWIAEEFVEFSKFNPNIIAAIAANQDFVFGLSRMWEALVCQTDWDTCVFRNRRDAEHWIARRVRLKFGVDDLTFA